MKWTKRLKESSNIWGASPPEPEIITLLHIGIELILTDFEGHQSCNFINLTLITHQGAFINHVIVARGGQDHQNHYYIIYPNWIAVINKLQKNNIASFQWQQSCISDRTTGKMQVFSSNRKILVQKVAKYTILQKLLNKHRKLIIFVKNIGIFATLLLPSKKVSLNVHNVQDLS